MTLEIALALIEYFRDRSESSGVLINSTPRERELLARARITVEHHARNIIEGT